MVYTDAFEWAFGLCEFAIMQSSLKVAGDISNPFFFPVGGPGGFGESVYMRRVDQSRPAEHEGKTESQPPGSKCRAEPEPSHGTGRNETGDPRINN